MTKNAIIVLCEEAIFIWAIPPLLPQPPDFSDHNLTTVPPLFTIALPDDFAFHPERIRWNTISPWYCGSSQHLYFDMYCRDSKLHRFQVMLEPDLSTASLHVINTDEPIPHDLSYVYLQDYMICEDALVSCWFYLDHGDQCGVYTGLTSARFADIIPQGGPASQMLLPDVSHQYDLFLCPASARFVLLVSSRNSIIVLDYFWYILIIWEMQLDLTDCYFNNCCNLERTFLFKYHKSSIIITIRISYGSDCLGYACPQNSTISIESKHDIPVTDTPHHRCMIVPHHPIPLLRFSLRRIVALYWCPWCY